VTAPRNPAARRAGRPASTAAHREDGEDQFTRGAVGDVVVNANLDREPIGRGPDRRPDALQWTVGRDEV
jgi:hypothetical protein